MNDEGVRLSVSVMFSCIYSNACRVGKTSVCNKKNSMLIKTLVSLQFLRVVILTTLENEALV